MKKKNRELDVDFIESKPLTKSEEKALSDYIKSLKEKNNKPSAKKAA
jgi:hypothetical protein